MANEKNNKISAIKLELHEDLITQIDAVLQPLGDISRVSFIRMAIIEKLTRVKAQAVN